MNRFSKQAYIAMLVCCSAITIVGKAKPTDSADLTTGSQNKRFPTASKLLDKYAETQDKLGPSFISKLEVSAKYEGVNRGRPNMKRGEVYTRNRRIEIRSDGERNYACHQKWGKWPGFNSGEKCPTTSYTLWDGRTFYKYGYYPLSRVSKNGTANLSYIRPRKPNITWQGMPASTLRGYLPGVSERIDSELRQARTISVGPRREEINGSKCYVINAKTKKCEYKIWIDPEHGYNIAKAIVKRAWGSWSRPELYTKRPPDGSSETEVCNVRFKKMNDIWLPVEADYRREYKYVNGDYLKSFIKIKKTEFVLNPDHDALGSFEPEFIRNGARVRISGIRDVTYTWQNGKIADENGRVIIDPKTEKPEKIER
jgi:hypothetical protein